MATTNVYVGPMTAEVEFPEDWPNAVWTDTEWHRAMLARLDKWLALPHPKPKLDKFMHMSIQGFIYWRETKVVPKDTRIVYTVFPEFLDE